MEYRLVGARYYRQSAAACLVVTTVYHVCVVGSNVRVPYRMPGMYGVVIEHPAIVRLLLLPVGAATAVVLSPPPVSYTVVKT